MKKFASDSVSVVIPAFNEEENIEAAVKNAVAAVKPVGIRYEVLIVDDGSTDKTSSRITALAKKDAHTKVFVHTHNQGMGAAIRTGITEARYKYITIFLGDNDTSGLSLHELIAERREADLVMAYTQNPQARSIPRRILSKTFVVFMNVLFGMHLRYFNGLFITRRTTLSSLPLRSDGHTLLSEIKVRLVKNGASYKEIPFIHTKRLYGETKAFRLKNILATLKTILQLTRDVYFTS